MKRKMIELLVVVLMITAVLVGCSGEQSDQNKDNGTEKEGVKESESESVTIRFWRRGNDPVLHDYFVEAIKRFEDQNEGYKVDFSEASYDDYDIKLNSAFASGDVPDVITHSISSIAERTVKGQFGNVDEYVSQWSGKDDIPERLMELGSYNDSVYGIPFNSIPEVLAFRKDYAQEAGLDPSNPPTTLAEFADWAEKLTIREGNIVTRSGFVIPVDEYNTPHVIATMLGDEKNLHSSDPTFDTPEMRESLTYLADLYKNGKVSAETTKSNEKKSPQFVSGKAAMQYMGPAQLTQMLTEDPSMKDNIGFIYLKEEKEAYWSGCQFFFLSSDGKQKDESWKLIEFLMTEEEVWNRYDTANIPVVRTSLFEKAKADDTWLNPAINNSIANGVGSPKVEWANLYLVKYTPQVISPVLLSDMTPDQAIKEGWAAVQQELEAMGMKK